MKIPAQFAPPNLVVELDKAIEKCKFNRLEETGGFILKKDDEYNFVFITNSLTGDPRAPALYRAEPTEFYSKVLSVIPNGWMLWATFHTHPSFSDTASSTDLTYLFENCQTNFIYSIRNHTLAKYEYTKNKWKKTQIHL